MSNKSNFKSLVSFKDKVVRNSKKSVDGLEYKSAMQVLVVRSVAIRSFWDLAYLVGRRFGQVAREALINHVDGRGEWIEQGLAFR